MNLFILLTAVSMLNGNVTMKDSAESPANKDFCVVNLSVTDAQTPLPAGNVKLEGNLEDDIMNSLIHWNKGDLPYSKFVDFFRYGRAQFALGEMWGKAVRSGAMFYRYTHDPELKKILSATVDDLLTTVRSNGSISCSPVDKQPDGPGGDLWERKYVLLGLEGYYEEVEARPDVLKAMMAHADCIIDQVGEAPKVWITDLGWSPNHIESTTLLEPFMRLYKFTGEQRYLDFAHYIVKRSGGAKGYDIFQQAYDKVLPHKMGGPYPKAYEMTSLFEGLVEYYRVTGDQYVKTCINNFFHSILEHELTIVGNAGADQPYHPAVMGEAWGNTALEQTNPDITRMMETCTGVTWMKFCSQVLRLTGDPLAVDAIENYVYNGLLGAMKPEGDGFSYVNLLNGAKVTNYGWGYDFDGKPVTCCNLNGPMGLAYIPFVAVMNSASGPVVNLYNSASVHVNTPSGKPATVNISSTYPLSEEIEVSMDVQGKEEFTMSFRIPSWTSAAKVKVNGHKVAGVKSGSYLEVKRVWKSGDKVRLVFPMECRLIPAPHGSNRAGDAFQALRYGPIVLARDENIDADYDKPVSVKADKEQIVKVKRVKPSLDGTRMEFKVPVEGGWIHMTDFASVNCWNGTHICTWLPTVQ